MLETTDYFPVRGGDWVYARFVSQSDEQTSGVADIHLTFFNDAKVLLREVILKRYTAAETWTRNERDVAVPAGAAFVKYRVRARAGYDGTVSSLNTGVFLD